MRHQIAFKELSQMATGSSTVAFIQPLLAVIPDFGCRLFVRFLGTIYDVMGDDGKAFYFPSIEAAIGELAKIKGVHQLVTVDMVSLMKFHSAFGTLAKLHESKGEGSSPSLKVVAKQEQATEFDESTSITDVAVERTYVR